MKKFLGTILLAILTIFAFTQPVKSRMEGLVKDIQNNLPIEGAAVKLGDKQTLSDAKGRFQFEKLSYGNYSVSVNSLGYLLFTHIAMVDKPESNMVIALTPMALFLQPLEVRAIRASDRSPFSKTNLSKEQINKNNLGQDLPFILNQTPSVVVNSDAGNGVGYTAIRIRGTDASRINVTINGIPYNDAESQGTYFVDLPDMASSLQNIQIQRGVGTSSNGAGAFGATLNLSTNEFISKAYGEFNNSFGSFNTLKNTWKGGTGLLRNHFTIDARLSQIKSDGFIDRAGSNLQSFYISAAYLNQKSSLRLNIFSGKEKTYQAWYGVPEDRLISNRTLNLAGTEKAGTPYENQTDNYTQTHYQLFFNHSIHTDWNFSTALFLTRGKGYYEEYKADQKFSKYGLPNVIQVGTLFTKTDLVRQRWLDNYFYGQTASLQYKKNQEELTFGGAWTTYTGSHFGSIPWIQIGAVSPNYRYYNYPATKTDVNFYTKWQHQISANWLAYVDLQYRHVNHDMQGFEGNADLQINRNFDFFNPKAGITYYKNDIQAFLSYAIGNKEPNRDDFQTSQASQPTPETLHNIELGFEKKTTQAQFGATLYSMYYKNQLVLTGQINDVGSYTRKNVPTSYRLGIELQGGATINKWFNFSANVTLSKNKINSFIEYIDNYDTGGQNSIAQSNTDISFSPSVISSATVNFLPIQNLEFSLLNKYVGKQYLDNSQDVSRKLNAFFVQDIKIGWTIKKMLFSEWHIIAQVYNVFNNRYEPNGYSYRYVYNNSVTNENGYYPMAGTNFMIGMNIKM